MNSLHRLVDFTALVHLAAALLEKEGHRVVPTPFAVDEGIDVIAAQQGELKLIQCKHTHWRGTVDIGVYNQWQTYKPWEIWLKCDESHLTEWLGHWVLNRRAVFLRSA